MINYINANCSCQNIPYMNYNDNNLSNKIPFLVTKDASTLTTNQNAFIYMIFREMYYDKIIQAVENAGNYNKDNKRYYFIFYDYYNKKNTKLNSREIWLAKNKIFTFAQLQCNVEYQLYNDKLINNTANNGYNFLSNDGFKNYLKNNIYYYIYPSSSCCEKQDNQYNNQAEYAFNERSPVYQQFYKIYKEALFYRGLVNKINQIKQSSLSGKENNLVVNFPYWLFSGLLHNQRRKLYSGKDVMRIYNTVRNKY